MSVDISSADTKSLSHSSSLEWTGLSFPALDDANTKFSSVDDLVFFCGTTPIMKFLCCLVTSIMLIIYVSN